MDKIKNVPDTPRKDSVKEVVVVSLEVKNGTSVGMSMIGRFWNVKGNVVINKYFAKEASK